MIADSSSFPPHASMSTGDASSFLLKAQRKHLTFLQVIESRTRNYPPKTFRSGLFIILVFHLDYRFSCFLHLFFAAARGDRGHCSLLCSKNQSLAVSRSCVCSEKHSVCVYKLFINNLTLVCVCWGLWLPSEDPPAAGPIGAPSQGRGCACAASGVCWLNHRAPPPD